MMEAAMAFGKMINTKNSKTAFTDIVSMMGTLAAESNSTPENIPSG